MKKFIFGGLVAAAMLAGRLNARAWVPQEHEVFARIEKERLAEVDAELGKTVAKSKKDVQEVRKEERKIIDSATVADVLKICELMAADDCYAFLLATFSERGQRLNVEEIRRILVYIGPSCDSSLRCRIVAADQKKFLETVDLPWADITGAQLLQHILPPLRMEVRNVAVDKWRQAVMAKEKSAGEIGKRPQDRDCVGRK